MKKVKLKYGIPVKKEGEDALEVNVLKFERLKLKHLKHIPDECFKEGGLDNVSVAVFFPLIAAVSGLPLESIEEIDLSEQDVVVDAITELLGESLGTGEEESGK